MLTSDSSLIEHFTTKNVRIMINSGTFSGMINANIS